MIHLPIYRTFNSHCYRVVKPVKKIYPIFKDIKINDMISNVQGLVGTIKEKDAEQIIVAWNDNTFERIKKAALNESKEYKYHYPETNFQEQPKTTVNKKAIKTVSIEETSDIDTAEELVKLAVDKKMIEANDYDLELIKVQAFDKETFDKYKKDVLSYHLSGEVSSSEEQEDKEIEHLTPEQKEAHKMLHKLRQNEVNVPIEMGSSNERRSLTDIQQNNGDFSSLIKAQAMQKPMSLDDSFQLLAQQLDSNQPLVQSESSIQDNTEFGDLDLDQLIKEAAVEVDTDINNNLMNKAANSYQTVNKTNFLQKPFDGITKPLLSGTAEDTSMGANVFKELFDTQFWTTIGRG